MLVEGYLYPEARPSVKVVDLREWEQMSMSLQQQARLSVGSLLCKDLRAGIRCQVGLTTSAGVSSSKLRSKLVSSLHKTQAKPANRVLSITSKHRAHAPTGNSRVRQRACEQQPEVSLAKFGPSQAFRYCQVRQNEDEQSWRGKRVRGGDPPDPPASGGLAGALPPGGPGRGLTLPQQVRLLGANHPRAGSTPTKLRPTRAATRTSGTTVRAMRPKS